MNNEEIIVSIALDGEIEVAVNGHAGPGCRDLTAKFEAALGETVADHKTPEYAQQPRTGQRAGQNAANRR